MAADEPARGIAGLVAMWRDASRRSKLASLAFALAIEALIVLLLLTLGANLVGEEDAKEKVTTFKAQEFAAPSEPEAEPEQAAEASAADAPQTVQPVPQSPIRPSPLVLNPQPAPQPSPEPAPPQPQPSPAPNARPSPKIGARIRPNSGGYGPVDTGNPRTAGDTPRVGSARNGEPLYAARWYREPTQTELAGYLSTANGPGYALIECKTVSGYYVEDCALVSEAPQGSQIGRAVLAAAWQFRVRPPRLGGTEKFGEWVLIRVTYTEQRAKP